MDIEHFRSVNMNLNYGNQDIVADYQIKRRRSLTKIWNKFSFCI